MSSAPWLAVALPVWRGVRYLPDALASLDQPGLDGVEIVAVDDGSDDGSADLLEGWRGRLPLRVERRPRGGNWVTATIEAIRLSRAPWISLLHQDDRWRPGRLAALSEVLRRHPEAALIVHAARFIDDRGADLGPWRCSLPVGRLLSPADVLPRLRIQNVIPLPAACFRRDAFEEAGGLDPMLWYLADWDLWLRLSARAGLLYLDRPLCDFRLHPQSQTAVRTRDAADVLAQFRQVQRRAAELARRLGVDGPVAERLDALALAAYSLLLAIAHDQPRPWGALWQAALRAGPWGCWRYARWSCLVERALPRWRLRRRMRRDDVRR